MPKNINYFKAIRLILRRIVSIRVKYSFILFGMNTANKRGICEVLSKNVTDGWETLERYDYEKYISCQDLQSKTSL